MPMCRASARRRSSACTRSRSLQTEAGVDGGGSSRLWAGAAHHDDPGRTGRSGRAAERARAALRVAGARRRPGGARGAREFGGRERQTRIGGPFLRAALGAPDDFKHVWLSARLAESHAVGARLAEAHTSSEIHFVGAYRLRVLRVELVGSDAAADELSAREGIRVSVAVDRVAAGPPPAAATLALPASGETAEAWLSTRERGRSAWWARRPRARRRSRLEPGSLLRNFRRGGRGVVDAASSFR